MHRHGACWACHATRRAMPHRTLRRMLHRTRVHGAAAWRVGLEVRGACRVLHFGLAVDVGVERGECAWDDAALGIRGHAAPEKATVGA